ncbi:MAG: hypothetical protein GEU73_05780 [Chloroflexi bacterium]|nr:hypothetical protein [Chloroflexota bacterium]
MIPLFLSTAFGIGVYLLYEGLTNPGSTPTTAPRIRGVEGFLARAGISDVTAREFIAFSLAAGVLVAVLAQFALGWALVSLLAGALGAAMPCAYYVQRHERRRAAVQTAVVEATAQLRDAIRTGLSVQEAIGGLVRTGPEILRPELTRMVREARVLGFERALTAMRERTADPVFDVVTAALLLNDRLGGRNVSQVLDRLTQATRGELRVQQELRAMQARNVLSARIVAAVPLVLVVAIRQLNPAYLAVFSDWPGQVLLAGCTVSIVVGYAGMLWTMRLPGERSVFRL